MWYLDGNNTFNSTGNTFNISFPLTGTYTIACLAQNLLSMRSNSSSVIIQDIITNLVLRAGNLSNVSVSQPMELTRFKLQMATGSNYACRVNYDTTQASSKLYFYVNGYIPGSFVTHQYLQPGAYNVRRFVVYSENVAR